MGIYQKKVTQKLNTSLDELWEFISAPHNLKKITPDYMGFDIVSKDLPEKMYEGMIIEYRVSPLLGIKTKWLTEITHVKEKNFFVDEQRIGPYKLWHHQHILFEQKDGVLMKDIVTYVPPFGIIGSIANSLIIKSKIDEIFDYRFKTLEKIYNVG